MAQLQNNLSGGMHKDNDPSAQPPNTYRDALNGTLTSKGNNRFSFESVYGNTLSFTLGTHAAAAKPFTPIGFGSFPDRLIVLSCNDNGGDGLLAGDGLEQYPGEIGEVTFNNAGVGTYRMLYYHKDFLWTRAKQFPKNGIVTKPENSTIKRIFFTNNDRPFGNFNVVDSRIRDADQTMKIVLSGSLVVGKQYMVVSAIAGSSSIVHNGNTYGPGHPRSNVFTAVNANYIGGGNVIEYIPIESLSVQPAVLFGEIEIKGFSNGGNLPSGSYQYFYQLGTSDGAYTNFSYVTREVSVPGSSFPGTSTLEYQQHQGATVPPGTSNKYVTLNITGIDRNFSKIRVGYIYSSSLGVYAIPKLFFTGEITGDDMEIIHYGSETPVNLANNDLTTPAALLDLVKSITSTKNLLFAANVGLARDPDHDMASTAECETFAYEIPGDTAGDITSASTIAAGYAPVGHPKAGGIATGNTFAAPGQWYEVISGSVIHNAVTYTTGQFFKTVLGNQVIDQATGPGIAVAVIRIQKYTAASTLDPDAGYKNIRILDDYLDYKGMLVSHYLMGYWRNEKQRFGMILWHKNGFPLYVRHLKDKTFPAHWNVSADVDAETGNAYGYNASLIDSTLYDSTDKTTALRILGARFNNLDFQLVADELTEMTGTTVTLADLPDHIKGFSIVRCPTDRQIVGQGILFPTVYDGATNIHPVSTNRLVDDERGFVGQRATNVYNWFSPEAIFQFDGNPSVASGDKLIIQDYYSNSDGGNPGLQIIAAFEAFYTKHYVREDAAPMAYTGVTTTNYQKGSEAAIIPGGTLAVESGALNVPITDLPTRLFQNTAEKYELLGSASAIGSRTMLVYAFAATSEATNTDGFGYHTSTGRHKAIVNWVRPKSNLYGGDSEEAKANNQYMFTGHFQPFDDDFMTYMTGTTDGGGVKAAGIVNNVEVFGGDCFVNIFDVVRNMKSNAVSEANGLAYAAVFPVESSVNTALREGTHFAKDRFYQTTEASTGVQWDSGGSATQEEFNYLNAYSNIQEQMLYLAKPVGFVSMERDENIAYFSLKKTDGELIDNFKRILVNNFQRSDSQFGAIYNAIAKGDKLFYWQFKGIGYMPVQERTTITSALGESVQLGVGGILERQDELDYYYGNQHQDSLTECEGFFAWYDFRRRAPLRMSFGGQMEKNAIVEGMFSYFQNLFENIESESSPNIFDSESPITGKGIFTIYDPRFKIVLMTFKFTRTVSGQTIEQDVTLGFSAKFDKFIGFFSFTSGIYTEHNGLLLAAKITIPTIRNSTVYTVGNELFDNTSGINKNYVCILSYTSGSPATVPSSDPTHWVTTSQINQIFVNWRGDICKFFGIVYPWHISVILGTGNDVEVSVDSIAVSGNDTRFTDVYATTSYQSASDTDIPTYHKDYEYYGGKWHFTIPLASNNERLSDSWTELKMRVKNYTGNAVTTSNNLIKRIFSITSEIRKRL